MAAINEENEQYWREAQIAEIDAQIALIDEKIGEDISASPPPEDNRHPELVAIDAEIAAIDAELDPPIRSEQVSFEDIQRGSSLSRLGHGAMTIPRGVKQLFTGEDDEENRLYAESASRGQKWFAREAKKRSDSEDGGVLDWIDQFQKGEGDVDAIGGIGHIATTLPVAGPLGLAGATYKAGAGISALTALTTPLGERGDDGWDFVKAKVWQTGVGAVEGVAGVGAFKGLSVLGKWIKAQFQAAPEYAAYMLRKSIGEEKADEVIRLLRADENPLPGGNSSATEVAVAAGSTKLGAIESGLQKVESDANHARLAAQDAEREEALKLFPDEDAARKFREGVTTPMRDDALGSANTHTQQTLKLSRAEQAANKRATQAEADRIAREADEVAAQQAAGDFRTPYGANPGKVANPRADDVAAAGEARAQAEVKEVLTGSQRATAAKNVKDFEAKGFKPTFVDDLEKGIRAAMRRPKIVGDPMLGKVLARVAKDLKGMVRANGTIHPEALSTYRMTSLDKIIDEAMASTRTGTIPRNAIDHATQVKKILDGVIDDAAGKVPGSQTGLWTRYLKAFTRLSRPVDQAKIGTQLQKSLRAGDDLVDEQAILKSADVKLTDSLSDKLNPDQMKAVNAVRADLARQQEANKLVKAGSAHTQAVLAGDKPQIVNALVREIMVANAVLARVWQGRQDKLVTELVKIFKNDPKDGYAALALALERGKRKQTTPGSKAVIEAAKLVGLTTAVALTVSP